MPAIKIVVRGRVQGVGFRYFTRETARFMGVVGEVWNRSDGSDEMIAQHAEPSVVDKFTEAIERGPGYIRDVQTEPTAERAFECFTVGPNR